MQGRLGVSIFGFFIGIIFGLVCLIGRLLMSLKRLFEVKTRLEPPACLLDPALGEHKYVKVNGGQKIHYVESGDSSKPLIVFLHGFPEFWFSWRNQIKFFNKDYRVVALDHRGYNDSGKPEELEAYLVKHIVGDLRGLVQELGVEKFTLVAHDWGSVIAWNYSALYPESVERLIIMNGSHPTAFREVKGAGLKQQLMSWYMIFFQSPVLPELFLLADDMALLMLSFRLTGMRMSEQEEEAYKYAFRDYRAWTSTINWYRAAFSQEYAAFLKEVGPKLSQMKQKTLILHGTGDIAISVGVAEASAKKCLDARLELIEGVGHWVQHEASDRVNQAIDKFLKE